MTRNPAIELYRVMLMFGICVLHTFSFGCCHNAFLSNVLCSCVVGFVLISGWFGVKFSWRKLLKLYGVGAYVAVLLFAGLCIRDGGGYVLNAAKAYNQFVHGFWFLHAYALMMALAPLVNAALEKGGKSAMMTLAPLILMVWCWGFGLTLPIVGNKLPRTEGLDAYGGITLLAIYAAARLCRLFSLEKRIETKWLWMALPLLVVATGIGLGDYNSPFAFALAGTCFLLVRKVKVGDRMGRIVTALAPSMFAVYLIHTNEIGLWMLKNIEDRMVAVGLPIGCAIVVTAAIVFFVSVVADLPRRVIK